MWITEDARHFQCNASSCISSSSEISANALAKPVNRTIKRLFDIFFSIVVLMTLAIPVFLPIAIGVRISSKGPVFFRQKRTGLGGKVFYCIKFRSMRLNCESDTKCATPNDERVTPFGRFLRRFSLDELPQFWNALVGDMSVVGPRPHMCLMDECYASALPGYMTRYTIKPGISGWAQINGLRGYAGNLTHIRRRVEHDIWYMDNWTFMQDMKIIMRTIFLIVTDRDKNAI